MILNGDCIEHMKQLKENSVDAIITDPPYGLEFMGKNWDRGVPGIIFWETMIRVLKPGGFLLSFGGTRTYHRLVCGIEDAGFEIRDTIMWLYGSGFPKSLNIGKQIDKLQGNEREVVGKENRYIDGGIRKVKTGFKKDSEIYGDGEVDSFKDITKGNSEWEGWGTALKPACEPIVVARKPLSEKNVALNVLKWGTGGINVDAGRINVDRSIEREYDKECYSGKESIVIDGKTRFLSGDIKTKRNDDWLTQGRFPANIILDEEAGKMLDEQSGTLESGYRPNQSIALYDDKDQNCYGKGMGKFQGKKLYNDNKSGASRFFYCAKASKNERNLGCEDMEEKKQDESRKEGNPGGDNPRNRGVHLRKNNHPTVKPIKLMEYLIKLVSKEGATVLDPFLGSGTTAVACVKLGRLWIGIEKEPEYIKIAEARIKHHSQQSTL